MNVQNADYAEGRILDFLEESSIRPELLQTFPYDGPRQRICYETQEFSAVCPFSGLPDYGKLTIEYIPKYTIVELKALKYYILSFRQVGIFQEPVTARIFNDLSQLLLPECLKITTVYNTRGGIDTTCIVDSQDQ